ncbi:MAG: aminoacyl-histidine dipeptidase [Lachnospiraceae bacterium]|nr:aminoacyl-histidine dipeptidase [Lachnospiraceae bacterium]
MVLSGLSPEKVFYYFEEICGIPHGSGNTRALSDYIVSFAKDRGFKYTQDESNNVIIYKDASKGCEKAPVVIIQGHIDMVCEQKPGRNINFKEEGLRLKKEGNIIYAEGTTLGGDDGIAVAYMLAILDSDDIKHPALECVFTSDEEIGLLGATALDCSGLKGRIMLNIDSEEEGQLLVSCAGGATVTCSIPVEYETTQFNHEGFVIKIENASGGHSGVEIAKQGANSAKLLGRVLFCLGKKHDVRLSGMWSGGKDNAIPREATAYVYADCSYDELKKDIDSLEEILKSEYGHTDSELSISVVTADEGKTIKFDDTALQAELHPMTKESSDKAVAALVNFPNGVIKYSQDIENLVQTSLNLGIMSTNVIEGQGEINFSFSVRSSVSTEKYEVIDRLECLSTIFGGNITVSGEYPAWEYRKESRLRDIMCDCYEKLYNEKPQLLAIHAGLECGIFAGKLPGLDCVSYGPDIKDIHTSEEKLYIDSVERTWEYTCKVLEALSDM